MNETPEQRARRLGLVKETPDERAQRLGIAGADPMADLMREQGLIGQKADDVQLDVRQRPESTKGLPYDPSRPGDMEALKQMPKGVVTQLAPELLKGGATLALDAAQGVPGMEAFEALAGSAGSQFTDNPMGFRESRDVLRGETSKIPKEIRTVGRLAAGGVASRMPGIASLSPAKAGGAFGATDHLLSADDMGWVRRLGGAAAAGIGGTVIGGTLDAAITGVRASGPTGLGGAPTPGANMQARKAVRKAEGNKNYGAARAEGTAAGGTSPDIQQILARPDVAPFAARVRGSRKYQNAEDVEVLEKVIKRVGKQERGLTKKLKKDGYDDEITAQRDDLGNVKDDLHTAAAPTMPSLRPASRRHAELKAQEEAVKTGNKAVQRVTGAKAKGDKIESESLEAYQDLFAQMTPAQKKAAIEGVLGGLDENIGFTGNLPSVFGVATSAYRPWKAAGFLRKVGDPRQRKLDDLVRTGALGATSIEELLTRD